MKRVRTNDIEQLIDTLSHNARNARVAGDPRLQQLMDGMLDGFDKRCVAEQHRRRRATAQRQTAISALSVIVIALCFLFNSHSYDRCNYVVTGQLTGHTEIVNNINTLFA